MTDTFVEQDCSIQYQGKTFTSGGSYRVGDRAAVYVKQTNTKLIVTTWQGERLGTAVVTSTWKKRTKFGCDTWKAYSVRFEDGSRWYGRHNADWADLLFLKRYKGSKL